MGQPPCVIDRRRGHLGVDAVANSHPVIAKAQIESIQVGNSLPERTQHMTPIRSGSAARRSDAESEYATREALVGTSQPTGPRTSWGAIIAGVVTFLAVTVLLSLVTAGIGLAGSGVGAGIWSIIALAIALAAGGYVTGALAQRSGLLHGFLTWATSLVITLVLAVGLSASALGAVGGTLGQLASAAGESVDIEQIAEDIGQQVDEQDVNEATEAAEEQAREAADAAQPGVWWTFVGMLLGAAIAAFAGALGVRTVLTRGETAAARPAPTRTPSS